MISHEAGSPRYYFLTLGCPKNTVDSEGMAMLLSQAGYRGTAEAAEADVLIVNTCGFLAAAEDESLATLRELAAHKRKGQTLVAAGCMAQRAGKRIVREVPGVDGLLGTRRWMEIVPFLQGLRGGKSGRLFGRYALLGDPSEVRGDPTPRPSVTSGSAYLKISDGCNAPCAFCSIPTFKGKLRSRPPTRDRGRGTGAGGGGRPGDHPDCAGHYRLRPRLRRPGRPSRPDPGNPCRLCAA